jgi:hypothetical protein
MSKRVNINLVLLVILLFACSYEAHADPLIITGGSLTRTPADVGPAFTFVGQDFSVSGRGGSGSGHSVSCGACQIGDTVNIKVNYVGNTLGSGPATINGASYPTLYYLGTVEFATSGIIGPPLDPATSIITITSPFTMSGNLTGYLIDPQIYQGRDPQTPVFSATFIGEGTAIIELLKVAPNLYGIYSLRFNFQAAPIPEPATLLLFGSGLAGVAARVLKRRKTHKEEQG